MKTYNLLNSEFIRFVAVGIVATATHYCVYLLFKEFLSVNLSYALGYGVSFLLNYVLSARFTFRSKTSIAKLLGFAASHAVNFALHIYLLNLYLSMGLSETIAPIPVYAIAIPVNFILVRFVFKRLSN